MAEEYNTGIKDYNKFKGIDGKITRLQADALAELGNIGAGASSMALSKFLNRDCSMSLPYINFLSDDNISECKIFNEAQFKKDEVAVVEIMAIEPNSFIILCLIDRKSCDRLLKLLFPNLQKVNRISEYNSVQLSLIKEVGSILILQYISALSKLVETEHTLCYPKLHLGRLDEIVNEKLDRDIIDDMQLGINLNIFSLENEILFDLTIIPSKGSIGQLLKGMGVE